jgi:hypothetical protein
MKKLLVSFILLTLAFTACRTLTSTTYIKADDAFVLGNNKHSGFNVRLKNVTKNNLEIWRTPIEGGKHSMLIVKPNERVKVNVEKNTALRINNNNAEQAIVELLVKGDTGLSMDYKN